MTTPEANAQQLEYWNGRAGQKWATLWAQLDAMLAPVTAALVKAAGDVRGRKVLDIGCGTGELTTILLKAGASVTGIDISAPMLAVARQRAGDGANLIQADASTWTSAAAFDLAISRFGVMFFDDPVAGFRNIHANMSSGGRLIFACWRTADVNDWVRVPMNAVRDLLPESPPASPYAPGPFALADEGRLDRILLEAGFRDIVIQRTDLPICLAATGGVDTAVRFLMQIGPAAAALTEADEPLRQEAARRLTAALAKLAPGDRISLGGSIWLVTATS